MNPASQRPGYGCSTTHRPIAELEHALNEDVDQREIQAQPRSDARVKEAIEIAAQNPGGIHGDAVDQTQVGQVAAGVVRRAGPPTNLANAPSVEIQLDEKRLGEPRVQIGPASDKAVVEV